MDTKEAGQGNVTCHIRSANGNDLDIDIEDNNDGTFNIFYTPHNPGNYTIKIKFGGQDVPNGDAVVMVNQKILFSSRVDPSNQALNNCLISKSEIRLSFSSRLVTFRVLCCYCCCCFFFTNNKILINLEIEEYKKNSIILLIILICIWVAKL